MSAMARPGLGQNWEPGALSRFPMWVTEAQVLVSFAVFARLLTRSRIGEDELAPMWMPVLQVAALPTMPQYWLLNFNC